MKKKLSIMISLILVSLQANDAQKGIDALKSGHYSNAMKYLKKSCSANKSEGCYVLALIYDNGSGSIAKNRRLSQKLYIKACNLGHNESCYLIDVNTRYTHKELTVARDTYIRDCRQNKAEACTYIGALYATGNSVNRNLKTASKYLRKGCDLGDKNACIVFRK